MKKRRTFTQEEKNRILAEAKESGNTDYRVAKKHHLQAKQLHQWRDQMQAPDSKPKVFTKKREVPMVFRDKPSPVQELTLLRIRIKQLEQIIGRQAVELDALKERIEA